MNYHWINLFNMVEHDGPFASVDAAKAAACKTFTKHQGGVALHIGIGDDNGPICEGSIRGGRWVDGVPELTDTQAGMGANYRDMIQALRTSAVSDHTRARIQPNAVHPVKKLRANIAQAFRCLRRAATTDGRKYIKGRKKAQNRKFQSIQIT